MPGIDVDLDMLETAVDGLRRLAGSHGSDEERGGRGDEAAIYSFSIRWGTLIFGRLERLEHYNRAGRLGAAGLQRYFALRCALRELEPSMRALGIAVPAIATTDAAT
ncbi:hypothetical protein [Tomitella cavernea]|uniref:Uncharacterized protein n=1 Tax=Tomitella cavernea TaxID=1387982 RepID=A0ABP9CKW0_9ACTN|nr:hypothetical protein [Tomitella cavernea]